MSNGSNNIEVAYQQIVDAFGQIDVEGVTVLTGNNGTGKSLVRRYPRLGPFHQHGPQDAESA